MLRDKAGTFIARLPLNQVVAGLTTLLKRLAVPQLMGTAFFVLTLLRATPAMAVQVHGPPEGFYVHQMAHFFFTAALLCMLYFLHVRPMGSEKAWHYFKLSLLFFLFWNIWTFTAHLLAHQLPPEAFAIEGPLWSHRFTAPLSFTSLLYYITRFDHLICLPGIWFLLLSLKTFCLEIASKREHDEVGHG